MLALLYLSMLFSAYLRRSLDVMSSNEDDAVGDVCVMRCLFVVTFAHGTGPPRNEAAQAPAMWSCEKTHS
jgi:hypothetical protein